MDFKGVNVKKLQYINELLTEQMNHWLMFPFVLLLSVYARRMAEFRGALTVFAWMLCSLLPLIFFILRMKVKSVARFLILQPVAALVPVGTALTVLLFHGDMFPMGRPIFIASAVCYMVHSALLYLKKREPFTGSMQLSLGIAIAAVCVFLESASGADMTAWMSYHIFPLILSVGLYFIIIYIQRYIDFLNVNKSSAGYLPATEILRSGLGLAMGYTIFGIVLITLFVSGPWLGRLGTFLKNFFHNLLKWLIEKIKGSSAQDELPGYPDMGLTPGALPDFRLKDTFWLWTVLEYVLIFALIIGLLVVFVRALIRFIQYLQRLALSRLGVPDMEGEEAFDIHEKCDLDDKTGKRNRQRFDPFSYRDRIRRLYKRKLLSAAGRMTPNESRKLGIYTAREWEQRLDAQGMASVYERARYSGQEMTAEDVKRMKDACR